jgi:hypothetical protein
VQVSDSVNGAWTRSSASTTWGSGHGDLALYYVQNSAPAGSGLTITISAASATYLQGAVSEYGGVATSGALDQAVATHGNSASVDSGATGSVGAGELVVGGIITGGSPGTVTPGSSAGQPFTMRAHTSGYSADLEDIQSSGAGAQDARATFSSSTDWYAAVATFHTPGSGTAQPPSVPAGLTPNASVWPAWYESTLAPKPSVVLVPNESARVPNAPVVPAPRESARSPNGSARLTPNGSAWPTPNESARVPSGSAAVAP